LNGELFIEALPLLRQGALKSSQMEKLYLTAPEQNYSIFQENVEILFKLFPSFEKAIFAYFTVP